MHGLALQEQAIINTVPSSFESGRGLFEFATEDCHLLAASMLQVPRPMDVPFNPSTSCQGATHVFVVFLLHHGLTVGVPAVVGRLGLVLDTGLGFWAHDGRRTDGRTTDGRNRAPPRPLFFEQETATELGSRFPFICGFKNTKTKNRAWLSLLRHESPCLLYAGG